MPQIEIDTLLGYSRDDRRLRAYAYLTASFQTSNETNDVLDCLVPFVVASAREQVDEIFNVHKSKAFLQNLGLTIPLYLLEQLTPRLQSIGCIEWNPVAKRHICRRDVKEASQLTQSQVELSDSFDMLEKEIGEFAHHLEIMSPPLSASWADALINFLKSDVTRDITKAITFRNAIIGSGASIEVFVIARYIQFCESNQAQMALLTQVFTGVLIEDFLNNIQEVGDTSSYNNLHIYYDTKVLLRLLGTSGTIHRIATLEMHQTLQSLGCQTRYLENASTELTRILDALIANHTVGEELFGETAEAMMNGEIDIGLLKDLVVTYEVRLSAESVYPFTYKYAGRQSENAFQIDEGDFVKALESEAIRIDRSYKRSNAISDAQSVAIIVRLRKGVTSRRLNEVNQVFVSCNRLLQRTGRRFAAAHIDGYQSDQIPPILTVGQLTTFAWLASSRDLEPHKVSRELLTNCYDAVQPSGQWTIEFAKALAKFRSENAGVLEDRANAALFITSARNTARDESANQASVLRKINMAEIFHNAALEANARTQEHSNQINALKISHEDRLAQLERERLLDEERSARILADEVDKAIEKTKVTLELETRKRDLARKDQVLRKVSRYTSVIFRVAVQFAFAICFAWIFYDFSVDRWKAGSDVRIVIAIILGSVTFLSLLDLFGYSPVKVGVQKLQRRVERIVFKYLREISNKLE